MTRVQVIEVDDKPVAYVVPADLWQRLKAIVEEAEDAADYERAVAQDDGVRFPASVALAMAEVMYTDSVYIIIPAASWLFKSPTRLSSTR